MLHSEAPPIVTERYKSSKAALKKNPLILIEYKLKKFLIMMKTYRS
jgi:hypothetical protein